MNFNQRLRQNLAEKGPTAARKWDKILKENALKFDPAEYQKAEKIVEDFHNQRNTNLELVSHR
ncbi:hypothetical protein ACQKGD_19470 [Peribacillus frigoritolerans]|jgi:hypothetical protein|uniref:hypothetical protein n=1 Tax=Peribacillus frigoritolerans TaxID=450367 RepID=UPI0007BF4C22|nr:hypothetical protein [Peribacillus frigoritolerans]USK64189.1 hypothetical protein LIT26_23860 [Peribacillus frigoritolerans]